MKQEKSISAKYDILRFLVLSSLLFPNLTIDLQAEAKSESKKPPEHPYAYAAEQSGWV
jgi:hypothetical protein